MGYFDKMKEQEGHTKIFLAIIISLIVVNLLAFKAILSIASNKTIVIEVPQFMESGKYVIGNTFANDNVYKMWTRIWIEDIANFSYKNIKKRTESLFPYLDPQTALQNKSKLLKFVEFVENNFITQNYKIDDIFVEDLSNGYKKITVNGIVKRKIGKKEDNLNGFPYTYEFIAFVRNGQIYINSIKSYLTNAADPLAKKKLENIDSVNYQDVIDEATISGKDPRQLKRDRMKKLEKEAKKEKAKKLEEKKKRLELIRERQSQGEM